ncbi:hypothetical protein EVAR_83568_1 [Eumeta japonica]|uniref:Histone-lysine N-methyltransferase SETMAR n=1 Tax=Eumeta variegata TaxID=151549 RepID=A0A4C1UNM8_EUMVA|nr:hypothetical protein EVAR_83568_1 [Eumeta japonica]
MNFNNEAPSRTTVFRELREFCNGCNSFDEEYTGRPVSTVTPDDVARVRKIIKYDDRRTCHTSQNTLGIASTAMYEILQDELKMKKIVSRWVPYNPTLNQKSERVRISRWNI